MANQFANRYVFLTPEQTTNQTNQTPTYAIGSGMTAYDAVSGQPSYIGGEVDDESITHQFETMYRSDMSRFGVSKSQQGKEYSEGGLNFAMQPDMFMGLHFYGVYGGVPTASTGLHTFIEQVGNKLPSFAINVGRDEKQHNYGGMCMNRLSLSANLNEYVMVSSDWNGKAEASVGSLDAAPVFCGAGIDAMHFSQCSVKFNENSTASTFVKSFSIEWNVNLDTDNACALGSTTYVRQPLPQMREISGSIEFARPIHTAVVDEPTYTQLITAGGLEVNPQSAGDYAIQVVITDGTSPCTIELYKVRWEAPTSNVSGRDGQTFSLNFTAMYDAGPANPANAMSKVLFNDHANAALQMHKL